MAIQDDYQKRLNDAVRAERLASEASQAAPVASIAPPASVAPERQLPTLNDLQSNVDRIQALSLQKQAALQEQALLAQQRPNQRFLNKDQSFMDAFRNPGAGQRDFALKAGLSLLSSGGTQDLSQRIGHALGAGVQGMQGAREAELAKTRSEAQSRFKQFGIQEQAERDLFNLNKEIVEEQRLAQAGKGPAVSQTSKLYGELEVARAEGNQELVTALTNKLQLETQGQLPPVDLDRTSTKAVVDDLTAMKENVMKTDDMLLSAQRAEDALAKAETGTFAKGKLGIKKLANLFGVRGFKEDISATEALSQVLGGNVLAILSSGDLGAGTGLSDKDVEFAKQVSAGTIELTEENIRYAIDAKRRAANYFRSRYVDSVNNYASAFEEAGKVPVFVKAQQSRLDRYKLIDFKPISKEGKLLFGSAPGALMQMRQSTGVLSPENAAAIGNSVTTAPVAPALNPKFEGVSTADLIGGF